MEMDSNRTVPSDGNIAKCQSVLVDVLRSESFAVLCDVLGRTVHQDEERTRYFDFGMIDSRMKNGDYGRAPSLFKHDLKLVSTLLLFSKVFPLVFYHAYFSL